jgi:L-lysine 2,3-aminomutase
VRWLAGHINHKDYVRAAVKLAIRKNQAKGLKAKSQIVYMREVDTLRNRIYTLLFYNQQKPQ